MTTAARNCLKKKAYTCKELAEKEAAGCMLNNKKTFTAYKCDLCGNWHLTKQGEKE